MKRATPVTYATFMLLRCLLGYHQLLRTVAAEVTAGGCRPCPAVDVAALDAAARRTVALQAAREAAVEAERAAAREEAEAAEAAEAADA